MRVALPARGSSKRQHGSQQWGQHRQQQHRGTASSTIICCSTCTGACVHQPHVAHCLVKDTAYCMGLAVLCSCYVGV
jgi:hypothetical protein